MVGTSEGVAQKAAEVAKENFEKMGFKINLRLVTQDAMYTKFCNSPAGQGRDLPERRLAEGLLGRPDLSGPDLQRRQHPPDRQLELVAARRPGR